MVRFARALACDSAYQPSEALAAKGARTLAREFLAMKRAKLLGLKRNAAVVLGNVGTAEDVEPLERAIDDEPPLLREHARWALAQLLDRAAMEAGMPSVDAGD